MRIVPRLNEDINEEWISDKTRFYYDGLKRQRLNDPMFRDADGRFKTVSWCDALSVVAEVFHQVKPKEIVGVAGKLSDAESMMALKDLFNKMGSNNVWCEGNGLNVNADLRSGYLLNSGISGLENADVFLLVGTQILVWTLAQFTRWLHIQDVSRRRPERPAEIVSASDYILPEEFTPQGTSQGLYFGSGLFGSLKLPTSHRASANCRVPMFIATTVCSKRYKPRVEAAMENARIKFILLRTIGFILPCYIISWVISLLHQRRQRQADVKKTLQTQGVEAANKLIHARKEHHPSYLIGRLVRKKEPK